MIFKAHLISWVGRTLVLCTLVLVSVNPNVRYWVYYSKSFKDMNKYIWIFDLTRCSCKTKCIILQARCFELHFFQLRIFPALESWWLYWIAHSCLKKRMVLVHNVFLYYWKLEVLSYEMVRLKILQYKQTDWQQTQIFCILIY